VGFPVSEPHLDKDVLAIDPAPFDQPSAKRHDRGTADLSRIESEEANPRYLGRLLSAREDRYREQCDRDCIDQPAPLHR
jgi:hypothetical protein